MKIWPFISKEDKKDIIIIAEQNGFSAKIHNSILSILEVMFGSKDVAEYYNTNYPYRQGLLFMVVTSRVKTME